MFYHGYDNYLNIAFPEDEIRPVSCLPLSRNENNPDNIGANDVLGNYSLTLIDTLSTLAVLASSPPGSLRQRDPFKDFQHGVQLLVQQYGDGSNGPDGQGIRAKGFDVDSKVQVFETVIRGVGGLLSAHLFAIGDLPIRGYRPEWNTFDTRFGIFWPNGFRYDGQLLRLAADLGERLLPAFISPTGIPYPRVNLRYGIPFYSNSPLYQDPDSAECKINRSGEEEITENCSAGAGSLVLEFVTLSRLTGDPRFEHAAKRAFWEIWNRRSSIGLVGSGIDAETGLWTSGTTGIGAGVDSFFEYAFKSHILLSGLDRPKRNDSSYYPFSDPSRGSIRDEDDDPDAFLRMWQTAHAAVKRHLLRDLQHPHYLNVHVNSGSPMAYWIDSLSAYYPGLLALAGEMEDAVSMNLLYVALWDRFSALPERWSTITGEVEGGLGWWPGRPELIESNYHLYQATKDPWYLHVGEMILKDTKRRCWVPCGWAGLQDVRTGELADRMESFFLGETTKYLFLLFDETHPLNSLDAPFVFSTEGHPLMVRERGRRFSKKNEQGEAAVNDAICPIPALPPSPFTPSTVAARDDLFHAASLARLYEKVNNSVSLEIQNERQPHSFYPWTLPPELIPTNGTSSKLLKSSAFEIHFPHNPNSDLASQLNNIIRMDEGLVVQHLEGVKLSLAFDSASNGGPAPSKHSNTLRIETIGNLPLGRDERVFFKKDAFKGFSDPRFTKVVDEVGADLYVEVNNDNEDEKQKASNDEDTPQSLEEIDQAITPETLSNTYQSMISVINKLGLPRDLYNMALRQLATSNPISRTSTSSKSQRETTYHRLSAISASGIGACPLPEGNDDFSTTPPDNNDQHPSTSKPNSKSKHVDPQPHLPWTSIYLSDETCHEPLQPSSLPSENQVIIIRRGSCSFSDKLANIPMFRASKTTQSSHSTKQSSSLQLVVIVSDGDELEIRPLLDQIQRTPAGLPRPNPIPMVMVPGGDETYELLRRAKGVGLKRRWSVRSQGGWVRNAIVI
ncbi:MAG: hypothetical protein M1823_005716 [Watsoniomyces obsoletus]|nr:MAG: hypothetical protein M1823_005716 [Watsoniomyces obsoletus]